MCAPRRLVEERMDWARATISRLDAVDPLRHDIGPGVVCTGRVRDFVRGPSGVLVVGGVALTTQETEAMLWGLKQGHRVEVGN